MIPDEVDDRQQVLTEEEKSVQILQDMLADNELQIKSAFQEHDRLIREIRKAKLDLVKPSTKIRNLVRSLSPMDDAFFTRLGEDPDAIGEVISTVLRVPVRVVSSTPQYTILNLGSRGVRLDNLAEIVVEAEILEDCRWGKKGTFVDIEVQKENKDDHEFRVYYNGASLIINKTAPGTPFKDIPQAIVIYISSFDVFHEGKFFYETVKVDKASGKPRRSPVTEFYLNTANLSAAINSQDAYDRKLAALMVLFRDVDTYDDSFPAFSRRKRELRETEKGVEDVSKELQSIIDEEVAERDRQIKAQAEELKQQAEELKQDKEVIKYFMRITGTPLQTVMDTIGIPAAEQSQFNTLI